MSMYKSLLLEGYYTSFITNELAQRYLKWISYVPRFWNIEQILAKDIDSLTEVEQYYLNQYQQDQRVGIPIFTEYLRNQNRKEKCQDATVAFEVHNYIQSHELGNLLGSKMSSTEAKYCMNFLNRIKNQEIDIESCVNMLINTPLEKRTIVEDYLIDLLIPELNKVIENKTKENIVKNNSIRIDSSSLKKVLSN